MKQKLICYIVVIALIVSNLCIMQNTNVAAADSREVAQTIPVHAKVKQVVLGDDHSAAITENGDLYCWGNNDGGQVGNGSTNPQLTPVKVLGNVKQAALGDYHSAAITEDGNLYCWGINYSGQVGNGTKTDQLTPVKVLGNVKQAVLGTNHSAAITEGGNLYCWGKNYSGQVGNGTKSDQLTPVKVLGNVKQAVLGTTRSAVVTENGDLYCWGNNEVGQVGNGTVLDQLTPVKVLENVKQVVLGDYHSAAITEDGNLYCWGINSSGQVGNGTKTNQLTPVKVLGNVKQAVLGANHSAAITEDGNLYCWGKNYRGQVGNGTKTDQLAPVKVLDSVKQVVLGYGYSAAITENGDLYCWGFNDYGGIGNGTILDQLTPVKVLENVKQAVLANSSSAALTENGDLYCWGYNLNGRVGNGSTNNQLTPVKIFDGTGSVIEQKICVFSTEKSLSVKTGESMWLAFGLMNVNTEELNGDWKKMSVSVSDPTIISLSDYEKTEYGYSLYVTGKKEGSTNVVITDTESGANTVIRVSVYDNYAQSYSYDINNVTSYYPQNDWDGNILTNIYNLNGLYVNNYNCENNSTTDDYHVSFDVYNTKYYYGAVDIYDENGMWMGYEEIKPYAQISSLWDTGKQAYYLITDTSDGKLLTYESATYSQHTHINIDVPQGGYFTISNNISESPGAYFVNAFQILFDGASTAFDLFTSDSTKQSALSNLLEQTKQSFADRLKEARNEGLKDVIKQKLQKAKIDTMKSEIKKIVKKFSNSTLKDQVLSADNMYADMATLAENFLNSFDISWKHLLQSSAGVGESLFTQFAGPAGVALKGCFAMSKTSNKLLMATQMAGSFESPYVTMYSDIEEGFINSYGVTVNTNGNVDADAVLQVFRVSNSDTIEMVLNSDNPLEIHELYNICFVKNDQLVQPNGKVKVYIPVPNGMQGNTCRVYRQETDDTWKIIDAYVEGNYLVFETDHFSYYAVVGDQKSMTISSLPDKTDYNEGEVLDTTGLILNVNGESISEGFICNPTVLSGNGKQTIQVLYGPLVTEFTVNVSGSKSMIYGDVDGNGSIDASDALMILKYSAKLEIPFGQKITAADVDNSGSIEANDALLVLKKVAKLIDHFPVEEQLGSDSTE